jgi:arylsulfatase A-like enzyme
VGHGTELYEPAVRTLLLARLPGVTRDRVDAPVALVDLAPTILALARVTRIEDRVAGGEGQSLIAVARAPDDALRDRPIFLAEDDRVAGVRFQSRAVIEGRFKYVRDVATGIEQLFDLEADPGEHENRRRLQPAERAHLAAHLEAWSAYVTGG